MCVCVRVCLFVCVCVCVCVGGGGVDWDLGHYGAVTSDNSTRRATGTRTEARRLERSVSRSCVYTTTAKLIWTAAQKSHMCPRLTLLRPMSIQTHTGTESYSQRQYTSDQNTLHYSCFCAIINF